MPEPSCAEERGRYSSAAWIIQEREYIKPSKVARMLAILDALVADSALSQQELGQYSGLSSAMVNQYLRELSAEGLVRYQPANGKSFHYVLTEKGTRLRRKMFATYSSELVRLYSSLKDSIREKLCHLKAKGCRKLVMFGADETCEVVLSAIRGGEFEVLAVVDNNPGKQGSVFCGHVVSPPAVLNDVICQAVVVTSYGCQDEICAQLEPLCTNKGMEIVRL
jgi:predicted transcriptional regulator